MELAAYLATLPRTPTVAWDSGCGSGQLSVPLADYFDRVEATDASEQQLAEAERHPRVNYRRAKSESSGLADASIDLAVCAQAAHWYDLEAYYREVRRIAAPGCAIVLVTYGRGLVDDEIRPVFDHFYEIIAGPYWPPERWIVEDGYRALAFPFREIKTPNIEMHSDWTLAQLFGYVDTWSAVRGMEKAQGRGPYEQFCRELAGAWGDPARTRRITWPLTIRAGHV